jgi:hypothetical protein
MSLPVEVGTLDEAKQREFCGKVIIRKALVSGTDGIEANSE